MAKQVKKWITINGNHVPVYEDGSLGGIATQFGQMRGSKTRTKDAVNKVMSDKGYQIEELEETDKRGRKLYKVTPPSTNFNKSPMKMTEKDIEEYASASLRADYRKSQEADLKEGEEYPIDVDRTKEKDRREKVKALEEAKAKEEGFASAEAMKAYEEEDRQSEKQAKSKSLADHSDIQKIAEEHVKKIWNGGAANRELYDAADKWAEEHNFDKNKARDAAFAAMNKKQMAEIAKREKAEGSKTLTPNEFLSRDAKAYQEDPRIAMKEGWGKGYLQEVKNHIKNKKKKSIKIGDKEVSVNKSKPQPISRASLISMSSSKLKTLYNNASSEEERKRIGTELTIRGFYRKNGRWSSMGGGR